MPCVAGASETNATPLSLDLQRHHQVGWRQRTGTAFRPFNQPQYRAALVQPEEIEFAGLPDPVQIQMPASPPPASG